MKAKADRAPTLEKAKSLISNPSRYNRATSVGAAKYVRNLAFDPKTGEVLEDAKTSLFLDEEKLKREEELDGYYAIITSEYQEADERIIELYRGLWKIEESFKVTKSDFETRPVYVSTQEHIDSQFLADVDKHLIQIIKQIIVFLHVATGSLPQAFKESGDRILPIQTTF